MNIKNFSRAQFWELRNGINGVGEFRYDAICSQNVVINRTSGLEIVKGYQNISLSVTHTYTQSHRGPFYKSLFFCKKCRNKTGKTERVGSVVTHETRIREVPGSNPGANQPDWGFFVVFLNHQDKCWVGFSLPRLIWPLFIKFIYHKINSLNLTNETLTTQNRNTQPSGTHPKTLDAIWPRCWSVSK